MPNKGFSWFCKIKHGKIQNLSSAVGLSLLAIINAGQRFLLVLDDKACQNTKFIICSGFVTACNYECRTKVSLGFGLRSRRIRKDMT